MKEPGTWELSTVRAKEREECYNCIHNLRKVNVKKQSATEQLSVV